MNLGHLPEEESLCVELVHVALTVGHDLTSLPRSNTAIDPQAMSYAQHVPDRN